jgi:tetratricopeptide (TPR) repeat protein
MKKTFHLFLFLINSAVLFGQNNYEKFKELYKKKDTANIIALFAEWEKTKPDEPELYTAAIYFYFSTSQQELISLDAEQKSKESLLLKDSTGKVTGYLNSSTRFNPEKVSKAVLYATKGIERFPDRLDIRFGKCYLLLQTGLYDDLVKEIIKTVEYSRVNHNKWLWGDNKPLENAEGALLETVQSYLKDIYDTGNDDLLPGIVQAGETVLKYYKNRIEILSTTAVALMLIKNYDKAIDYLKQAEQLNPKDFIVLNNIARGYELKGDKENAIKYYKLTEKYGDKEAKEQAKKHLRELKQ